MIINCMKISDIDDYDFQLLKSAVSKERRMRAERFRFTDDSKRCICAELLLQYSLFQAIGRNVELDIGYNEFGKPFMKNTAGFFYNLSHSGKWVVIAHGKSEIGIDIEKIRRTEEDIAYKFFAEEEQKFICTASGNEKVNRFTQVWTLKESYIKYLGTGLSTKLDSFTVNTINGAVISEGGAIQKNLGLKSYLFRTDYFLAICSEDKEVSIHEIMLADMIRFIYEKIFKNILGR